MTLKVVDKALNALDEQTIAEPTESNAKLRKKMLISVSMAIDNTSEL